MVAKIFVLPLQQGYFFTNSLAKASLSKTFSNCGRVWNKPVQWGYRRCVGMTPILIPFRLTTEGLVTVSTIAVAAVIDCFCFLLLTVGDLTISSTSSTKSKRD